MPPPLRDGAAGAAPGEGAPAAPLRCARSCCTRGGQFAPEAAQGGIRLMPPLGWATAVEAAVSFCFVFGEFFFPPSSR